MTSIEKFQSRIEYYVTRMQNFWATNIIAYKPKFKMTQNGENIFAFTGNLFSSVLEGKSTDTFSFTEHLKGVLIILSPLPMVLTIFYMLKRVIRHQKHTRKMQLNEQQTHAREMYLKLIQKLSKLDVNINNLSAEELLEQLTGLGVFPPDQVKEISGLLVRYHEVRFGQQALHETELQQYAAMIKQLRNQHARRIRLAIYQQRYTKIIPKCYTEIDFPITIKIFRA